MGWAELVGELGRGEHRVLSTDVFDTVLLRDGSTETRRLARAARRAATVLDVDPVALARLRWSFHATAYRAVAVERPLGEASLASICAAMARALGAGPEAARVLHEAEVDVDVEHLRPHRALVALLDEAATSGTTVIAVSDTYYGTEDLHRMLAAVVGKVPFTAVFASADVGLTKHAGGLYGEVARRIGVPGPEILHVGDDHAVDVASARAASWRAVHLPRTRGHGPRRVAGRLASLPLVLRRTA